MNWHSASQFFAMGGYGLYVWGAYGVCAACMLIEPALTRHWLRQALKRAAELNELDD